MLTALLLIGPLLMVTTLLMAAMKLRAGGAAVGSRPEGVRIIHAGGTVTLCELAYMGVDADGFHMWSVATEFNPWRGDRLVIDHAPDMTGLSLRTSDL